MKQLLRIEVEPLPEQRWARIERSLVTRLEYELEPPRRASERPHKGANARTLLFAALAMAAAAALVILIPVWRQGTTLEHPSRITTGPSPSHLALPGLVLDVEPESAVVVGAETPQGMLVVIDRGSIVCQVAPRPSTAPLIVQAGELMVKVVGTRFSVTRLGEVARVKVFEGVVEITSRGESTRVSAGESWPPEVRQPTSKSNSAAEAGSGDVTLPLASSVLPGPVLPGPALRSPAAPQAPRPSAGNVRADAVVARRSQDPSPAVEKSSPSVPPSKEAAAAQDVPRRSRQDVFEEATTLERSDPSRAARLYHQLESGSDSWAQNALYARGRLAASRGNSGEARRLLEQYLARFPRGSNAEDARALLGRLR